MDTTDTNLLRLEQLIETAERIHAPVTTKSGDQCWIPEDAFVEYSIADHYRTKIKEPLPEAGGKRGTKDQQRSTTREQNAKKEQNKAKPQRWVDADAIQMDNVELEY
jgi:hypothetical protein